jgi:hypothetical protein
MRPSISSLRSSDVSARESRTVASSPPAMCEQCEERLNRCTNHDAESYRPALTLQSCWRQRNVPPQDAGLVHCMVAATCVAGGAYASRGGVYRNGPALARRRCYDSRRTLSRRETQRYG